MHTVRVVLLDVSRALFEILKIQTKCEKSVDGVFRWIDYLAPPDAFSLLQQKHFILLFCQ